MPIRTIPLGDDPSWSFGIQSPDDRLDYTFLTFLDGGEALLSPEVTVSPADLTIDSVAIDGGEIIVWLEGGEAATEYEIGCVVATSFGRVLAGRASLFVGVVGLDDPSIVAPAG
jgi:hypothetical protein